MYERCLLSLMNDDDKNVQEVREILKSPYELSHDLIRFYIENELDYKEEILDTIKSFAGGIFRARHLSDEYVLARYYSYMFAFHQFFHSSFRARQGKVLEELFKNIIRKCNLKLEILSKKEQMNIFSNDRHLPDFDVFISDSKKIVIIQIRSRDDTGGTTAKSSLVEGFRYLEKSDDLKKELYYIVHIWEARQSAQKDTTIIKFHTTLTEHVEYNHEEFKDKIVSPSGVKTKKDNHLFLTYGNEEFSERLTEILKISDNRIQTELNRKIELISNWDDLWLAYAIINLEYEQKKLDPGNINTFDQIFNLLNKKYKNYLSSCNTYNDYIKKANEICNDLLNEHIKTPFCHTDDVTNYIMDIVLLIMIYFKKKSF